VDSYGVLASPYVLTLERGTCLVGTCRCGFWGVEHVPVHLVIGDCDSGLRLLVRVADYLLDWYGFALSLTTCSLSCKPGKEHCTYTTLLQYMSVATLTKFPLITLICVLRDSTL
jgi:hypothetical protein